MKWQITKLGIIVLIAALVNQLVAFGCAGAARMPWGCRLPPPNAVLQAMVTPPGTPTAPPEVARRFVTQANQKWGWPSPMYEAEHWQDVGYESSSYAATPYDAWNGPRITYIKAGWPFLCYDGALGMGQGFGGPTRIDGMIKVRGWQPASPRWRELLLNVGLFAVAIFALQFVSIRASRLAKRLLFYGPGLCKSCGYDLRGTAHERCPECGSETLKT